MRQVIGWRGSASDDDGEWNVFDDVCRVSYSRPDGYRDGFYVYASCDNFFSLSAAAFFEHSCINLAFAAVNPAALRL
ncbi:MAG TPA: hypothetical protein VFI68_12695 [Anaerolineales bacterium]|nr:hypothetical protein [Anaerolineales bacterium]